MKKNLFLTACLLLLSVASMAQVQMYTLYSVNFRSNNIPYEGLLKVYEDNSAVMRVKYYAQDCNCVRMVEQLMRLEYDMEGNSVLKGYYAYWPENNQVATTYSPDSFYLVTDPNGMRQFILLDAAGNSAPAEIKEIIGPFKEGDFLKNFNWWR